MPKKSNPRVPRKKGQPAGSKKHSDLYTDENPKGTIKGLKFATVKDAKASVSKINGSGKSHAHKIQAAVAMEQRAKEMGKTSQAGVYRAYINKMKKITKKKNENVKVNHDGKAAPCGSGYEKVEEIFNKINEKLSKSQIKKMKDKFDKTGKLPPHLEKLSKLMDKHAELKNVVVPGLEWMADLDEGWSDKYKKSIDCSNPKGFSQKAHCAGKKKTKSESSMDISKEKLTEMILEEYCEVLSEKKDACYHKVKARYDVWPSAYASGALVKCRKVGAKNWGNKSKKESVEEARGTCWVGYQQKGMKKKGDKMVPNCVKEVYYEENGKGYGYTFEFSGEDLQEAEYQCRKVKLNKIMQGDKKKFKVYVKNDKGNVVVVHFGQGGDAKGGTMRIRKANPAARKSFRARHNCDNPGPRHKARYWSCKKW